MAEKRLYWLKLEDDFFRRKVIKKLRRMAGGDTYVCVYLKLLLLGLRNEGRLHYDGVEETFAEELALEIDEDAESVKFCLLFLEKVGLAEIVAENEVFLAETPEMTFSETRGAARTRRHRAREALQCNASVTPAKRECNADVTPAKRNVTRVKRECNTEIDIDIDIEKEIDKERDKERDKEVYTARSCEAPSAPAEPPEVVCVLPCVKGEDFPITGPQVERWEQDFPNVDVHQALRNMRSWLDANPTRRKTKRGCPRFIVAWLARDQDSGKNVKKSGGASGGEWENDWLEEFRAGLRKIEEVKSC